MSAVAAASAIPNIFGGFAPFPNSIMIPFMGAQSAVLGYQFGLNYEIGKRTIKAMDNDFFNKIFSQSTDGINVVRNGVDIPMQYKDYIQFITKEQWEQQITTFRETLPGAQSLMNDIIEASVDIELKKAERTPSAWAEILHTFGVATAQLATDTFTPTQLQVFLTTWAQIMGIPVEQLTELYNEIANVSTPEEPDENQDPAKFTAHTVTIFWHSSIAGDTITTFESGSHDLSGHQTRWNSLKSTYNDLAGSVNAHLIPYYDLLFESYVSFILIQYGVTFT